MLPGIDGRRLDDIVGLPHVRVRAGDLARGQREVTGGMGYWLACVLLAASAFGFARVDAKSVDHFFTGFPSTGTSWRSICTSSTGPQS